MGPVYLARVQNPGFRRCRTLGSEFGDGQIAGVYPTVFVDRPRLLIKLSHILLLDLWRLLWGSLAVLNPLHAFLDIAFHK